MLRSTFLCAALLLLSGADDETGRDFPKTLIFDEPGIDDEISLPTLILQPHGAPDGDETDIDFELDKRLTEWLSLQVNVGYTALSRPVGPALGGWQNDSATLKFVLLTDRPAERLISLSLSREFGRTGALQIGSERFGSSIAAVNAGQGFAAFAVSPLVRPFAVTSSIGYDVPDREGDQGAQQAVLSASLQYSLDVLASSSVGIPTALRPLIPIVEVTYAAPAAGHAPSRGTWAPGLIYSGDGFQLAAEALVPITRAAGSHVGFIAQLNISLIRFGVPALARPVF